MKEKEKNGTGGLDIFTESVHKPDPALRQMCS